MGIKEGKFFIAKTIFLCKEVTRLNTNALKQGTFLSIKWQKSSYLSLDTTIGLFCWVGCVVNVTWLCKGTWCNLILQRKGTVVYHQTVMVDCVGYFSLSM